ncbi:DUF4382 domain-containing protein [Desulforegula conservatrix]|uniref:DUF4382 domain-containing protein n=1 Tax=Desulforegula conservatrix TaxID=153026 RepID=UPI00042A8439|nr:DUF4382 domain-containing protein [Desulforegula conservatrix]
MKTRIFMIIASLFVILSGCSGSSSSSDGDGTGKVTFSLKDAPAESYKAVYVSVARVEVQKNSSSDGSAGTWITVSTPQKTYNLLELVNGAKSVLGSYELEDGAYGQIRLILSDSPDTGKNINGENHPYPNYVIDSEGVVHKLKVPSGYQSGIKIVGGFSVNGQDFEILLDFDAAASVVKAGNSGQWLLKSVIKSIVVTDSGRITGVVKDPNGNPVEDVLVSVQKSGSAYPEIVASSETDDDGKYSIDVPSGSYTLVFSDEDYRSACEAVSISANTTSIKNFSLSYSAKGVIAGALSIAGMTSDASVTLHFLTASPCSGTSLIEVGALNIVNRGEGEIELPEGTYLVYYVHPETGASGNLEPMVVNAGSETIFEIDL